MGDIREEMLLLPGPIHRYRDPDSGLQDGALFAFAAYGTNPDLLIAIELQGAEVATATWNYACFRMTASQLNVRLDGKEAWNEVWAVPDESGGGGKHDSWLYFFSSQRGTRQTGTVTVPAIGELVGTVDTGPVSLVVRRDADAGRASTAHPLTEGPQMQPPPANFEQPKLDVTAGRLALVQAEKRLEVSKQELAPMEQLLKTGRILESEVAEGELPSSSTRLPLNALNRNTRPAQSSWSWTFSKRTSN